ncbi:UNVERIFIED_CONTAM: hypothetical protein Slati_2482500 [Sesamum latifolium]|uniref:Integrase catalytic domain-containing protein n=1 Tax=Sesamum latifolium TaxID=2727402 RepID=A0AAW2WIH6_9LAMI
MSKNLLTLIMDTNKFNGTNYDDLLRNLRIVLDFKNQGYILDKPLVLPERSSPEERLTFDKWLEDNPKICREKTFFGTKIAEGSSVQSHGVKMLFLVGKLEDLKAGLENDTYIDVILQSLPSSYDPFIVNYNMNGHEKSIHELINMLVQYEATTHKSAPTVLVGEASTSKAKGKRAGCWNWKKGKGKAVTATASAEGAPAAPTGKGKEKARVLSGRGQMMCACIAKERGIGIGSVHNSSLIQVLERSRKLSKDEMILRLGDGKAVAAEAVGSLSLVVSDHIRIELEDYFYVPSMIKNIIFIPMLDNDGFKFLIDMNCFYLMIDDKSHLLGTLVNGLYILQQLNLIMTAQHKWKVDNHESAKLWHAWLGHISKDRIRKLVDSKSLEVDDLGDQPTCESCLKGNMTKKPFVGQSAITNSLLELIHTDVYGPLNTLARGGFSYFITFTNGHSRYGYIYLMRYKSEAFGRFKEYRLEVENQTGHKIKALLSYRGGEYLSGGFIDYLKENGLLSHWTPLGMPQLNRVIERRNRTLLDMVRCMTSFTKLPPSFWGYALETAAKLLNIVPSKTVPLTPYEIWHGKSASYKYLRMWGSPVYVKASGRQARFEI